MLVLAEDDSSAKLEGNCTTMYMTQRETQLELSHPLFNCDDVKGGG